MKKWIYVILSLSTITISCSKDDYEIQRYAFAGFYQVQTMQSDKLVDLNGDSQKSRDLKSEINNYFNDFKYDFEIRPNQTNDTEDKLISIYFPEPSISFDYPSSPNGSVEYARNVVGFRYEYQNKQFKLFQTDNEFAVIDKIELLDSGKIKSTIHKDYYDFETQNWINLKIEIEYVKMK